MALNDSWKVTGIVFLLVLAGFGGLTAYNYPLAMRARAITGYATETEARAALARNPRDARAHRTFAEDAVRHRDYEAAVREWQEAARLEPENGHNQLELGFALLRVKRRDEAKRVFVALAATDQQEALSARRVLAKLH